MTFEEILDQAIEMLRRRGRMTYRALKLHFHLDDEALDVLAESTRRWGEPMTGGSGQQTMNRSRAT